LRHHIGGHVARGLRCTVDEGAALDGVGQVALLFEMPEDGADGGVLEKALAGPRPAVPSIASRE
ncbi:MAG TPA: hypothetical protein VMR62_26980, partial [Bryobacteraceae bacterium]|nr:hypothetical protein [Bryobacteraceae bacterium]